MLVEMDPCPHCGEPAHLDAPCAQLAPVAAALRFPSAFSVEGAGNQLFVRTVDGTGTRVALTAFAVAGAFGALMSAQSAGGVAITAAFGVAAAIALAVAGSRARAVRVGPHRIDRFGEHAVSGLPQRLTRKEVRELAVQPTPHGFAIVARGEKAEARLLAGLRSRVVAELLAKELERVFSLEPFVGERPLPLAAVAGEHALAHANLKANDDELIVRDFRGVTHIRSDDVVGIDVIERMSAPDAEPTYLLELRTRRGEVIHPLAETRRPAKVIRFARRLRGLWRLER